jgi:hypothetical protein
MNTGCLLYCFHHNRSSWVITIIYLTNDDRGSLFIRLSEKLDLCPRFDHEEAILHRFKLDEVVSDADSVVRCRGTEAPAMIQQRL